MRLITYHTSRSTGIGGIENLYRGFLGLSTQLKMKNIELFHRVNNAHQCKPDFDNKEYIHIKEYSTPLRIVNDLLMKLTLAFKIITLKLDKHDIFVLNNPSNLIFIPNYVLSKTNVVLVQANNIDTVYSTFFSKLSISFKKKHIKKFTVYTPKDKYRIIERFNLPEDKIVIIPRGCRFKPLNISRDKVPSKKLVTICRIEERQKYLSKMVSIIRKLPSDYSLDIYGDGPVCEVDSLVKLIRNDSRIKFCGPTNDVPTVLASYSIFLMTSRWEGFGQSLIEARSQGLPIVAFNTFEAADWIVKNGLNGYLIEPFNEDEFVNSIVNLCSNRNLYSSFSKNSLIFSNETLIDNINVKWIILFKKLLGVE